MNIADKILQLQDKITEEERNIARYEGQLESIKESLKTDFNCDTIEQAEEKYATLNSELETLKEEYKVKLQAIKEEYPEELAGLD